MQQLQPLQPLQRLVVEMVVREQVLEMDGACGVGSEGLGLGLGLGLGWVGRGWEGIGGEDEVFQVNIRVALFILSA